MKTIQRRYDIDWLRVIAIGLLLIYHISIVFQPWGVFIGFIQSSESLDGLWKPMSMLNVWRIPLLFFISGMGLAFASRKRSLRELILERTRRILVPLLFGMIAIVPIHLLLWQSYYSQDLTYRIHPSHLWFLANIFAYVLLFTPILKYLSGNNNLRIFLEKLYRNPAGLLLILAAFAMETTLVNPDSFETFAMSWHGFFTGMLAFIFGYSFIISNNAFWENVRRWKWVYLSCATGLYLYRLIFLDLSAPGILMSIESNLWIFSVLGVGYCFLDRPGKTLAYLSQSAYPVYILHMVFLYLGSMIILPLEIATILKFVLIVIITFAGTMLTYEFVVRRIRAFRLVFGLKVYSKAWNPEGERTHSILN